MKLLCNYCNPNMQEPPNTQFKEEPWPRVPSRTRKSSLKLVI